MSKAGSGGPPRGPKLLDVYTRDVTGKDMTRVFTREALDAYRAFSRTVDEDELAGLRGPKRITRRVRAFLIAFGLKLSPARRVLFGGALMCAVIGFLRYNHGVDIAMPPVRSITLPGAWFMIGAILLLNLLVVLEVADRLSLKNDLEIARDIQLAMLPAGTVNLPGVEVHGMSKPANTVGGDFYDVRRLPNGNLLIAVGDVAGKGSPAALLMALFLAMERVLLDELQDLVPLTTRLNGQIVRQAPGTRFITLFIGSYDPVSGRLEYVNAGHPPGILRRADGAIERLQDGGVALGMFEGAQYTSAAVTLQPGDLLAAYSDGITEAEHPERGFFDEAGLLAALADARALPAEDVCRSVFGAVRAHTDEGKLGDDLTMLVLRRQT